MKNIILLFLSINNLRINPVIIQIYYIRLLYGNYSIIQRIKNIDILSMNKIFSIIFKELKIIEINICKSIQNILIYL